MFMRAECFTTVFLCKSYTSPSFLSDFHPGVSFAVASCQPGGDADGGGDFGIAHGGVEAVGLSADGEAE